MIVICSQSSLLRRNLSASLVHLSLEVLETDSSISLVSACLTRGVGMVIIDSDLEFLSAPDTIRCLRYTDETRSLPIIALGNNVHELHEAIQAGADHGLAKPVEIATMLKLLLHLEQARQLAT